MVGPLIWVAIALFILGAFYKKRSHKLAAAGWIVFGLFWALRFPIYYNVTHSMIKSVLSLAALPLSMYVAYDIVTNRRDSFVRLSRAVAVMGLIYLPFAFIQPLRVALIEHTAAQAYRFHELIGTNTELVARDGVMKEFQTTNPATGETYVTYIILACTGIGSMAIFGGVIAAVGAPLENKLKALSVSIPVIYVLNIIRNAFITRAYGYQWFPIAEETISDMMGESLNYASFFWADKVISQSLSVVALIGITFLVIRFMPQVMDLIQDVLSVFTGSANPGEATEKQKHKAR